MRARIREIAACRPRFGYKRIWVMLRHDGWAINHKRVHRLYRLDGLQLRMRMRRRKHMSLHRGIVSRATALHERLSMDFVHDQLFDQWSREAVLIEPAFSFSGQAVAEALDRWVTAHGVPVSITVDRGTEFTSKALEEWAWRRGVKLDFVHPGKPMENGHIESFNGRLRDEYNRPHGSLGHLTPSEFIQEGQFNRTPNVAIFQ